MTGRGRALRWRVRRRLMPPVPGAPRGSVRRCAVRPREAAPWSNRRRSPRSRPGRTWLTSCLIRLAGSIRSRSAAVMKQLRCTWNQNRAPPASPMRVFKCWMPSCPPDDPLMAVSTTRQPASGGRTAARHDVESLRWRSPSSAAPRVRRQPGRERCPGRRLSSKSTGPNDDGVHAPRPAPRLRCANLNFESMHESTCCFSG